MSEFDQMNVYSAINEYTLIKLLSSSVPQFPLLYLEGGEEDEKMPRNGDATIKFITSV